MNRQAIIFQLVALGLLIPATALEVSGAGFPGIDLLISVILVASVGLACASTLRGGSLFWGALTAGAAALGLVLHLCLNMGLLS